MNEKQAYYLIRWISLAVAEVAGKDWRDIEAKIKYEFDQLEEVKLND